MRVHPVFHVSLLKEFNTNDSRAKAAPQLQVVELIDGEEHWKMDQIVGERKFGREEYTQFLIRWTDGDERWESSRATSDEMRPTTRANSLVSLDRPGISDSVNRGFPSIEPVSLMLLSPCCLTMLCKLAETLAS